MTNFWISAIILLATALSFIFIPLLRQRQWALIIILVILVPAASIMLYLQLGASQQWQTYQQHEQLRVELDDSENIITMLEARLQQEPDSAEGWFWLGRIYLGQEKYHPASKAFARAYQLQPDNHNIALHYVQTTFLINDNQLNEETETILTTLLTEQPNNLQALNILALARYEQQNYQAAIKIWQTMLEHYPQDSPEQQVINMLIDEAQSKLTN